MKSQSFDLKDIYLDSIGIIVSKKEKEGPLGKYFKSYLDDYYCGCKSFEKAQIKMTSMAIKKAIAKSIYNKNDLKIAFGGDLSNQIFSSTGAISDKLFPFVGLYAACASGILAIILASIYMQVSKMDNALAFTSSHLCVSQRQLRYPNEYASLLKDTTTTTVTGACAIILTCQEKAIKITKATIGKVIDILSTNVNDMGSAMAYAAFDTFKTHLENNLEKVSNYDLIVTGDLGTFGSKIFLEEVLNMGVDIQDKYLDCGASIYDNEKQKTAAGGSGPACVMCVTFSYVIDKILKHQYQKVLVIATGALHSQISFQQKESIPAIAHAIVLEGSK